MLVAARARQPITRLVGRDLHFRAAASAAAEGQTGRSRWRRRRRCRGAAGGADASVGADHDRDHDRSRAPGAGARASAACSVAIRWPASASAAARASRSVAKRSCSYVVDGDAGAALSRGRQGDDCRVRAGGRADRDAARQPAAAARRQGPGLHALRRRRVAPRRGGRCDLRARFPRRAVPRSIAASPSRRARRVRLQLGCRVGKKLLVAAQGHRAAQARQEVQGGPPASTTRRAASCSRCAIGSTLASGRELTRYDGKTPRQARRRRRASATIASLTACGDGMCALDSNCMQLIQFGADGKVLRRSTTSELFDVGRGRSTTR